MAKTDPMRKPSTQVIADQVQLRLPKKQWKQFCDALDAPPKTIPALRKLLIKSGPFDGTAENSVRQCFKKRS